MRQSFSEISGPSYKYGQEIDLKNFHGPVFEVENFILSIFIRIGKRSQICQYVNHRSLLKHFLDFRYCNGVKN